MRIIIDVDDSKVLEAVNAGFRRCDVPEEDLITDVDIIDESDISRFVVPSLEIEDTDIQIER